MITSGGEGINSDFCDHEIKLRPLTNINFSLTLLATTVEFGGAGGEHSPEECGEENFLWKPSILEIFGGSLNICFWKYPFCLFSNESWYF